MFERVSGEIDEKLRGFSYDLKPLLEESYERVRKPLPLPMDNATGCAELRVLGVEAAPLILADGIEKDFALVVAPSITIPCTPQAEAEPLPPLENVATVPTGPFTVTVPVVASYAELTRGLGAAFTDGKLFFSNEHPKLYLEKPELYESSGALVLRLHIAGPVHELGIDAEINGDLYLVGSSQLDRQRGRAAGSRTDHRNQQFSALVEGYDRQRAHQDRGSQGPAPRSDRAPASSAQEAILRSDVRPPRSNASSDKWTSSSSPSCMRTSLTCA